MSASGAASHSAFQPEFGALLNADLRVNIRAFQTRWPLMVLVLGMALVMSFMTVSVIVDAIGFDAGDVVALAPFTVPLFALSLLYGFGQVGIASQAMPVIQTVPCRTRPLYAHSVAAPLISSAFWSLFLIVASAAYASTVYGPQTAFALACAGLFLPLVAVTNALGQYLSALTAPRGAAVRWATWAALSYFLLAPLVPAAFGFGYAPSVALGGPATILSETISFAVQGGVLPALVVVAAACALGCGLVVAPLGRSMEGPARLWVSPYIAGDEEELPDIRPTGVYPPSPRVRETFEKLRRALPETDKGPSVRPLDIPEGQAEALRFLVWARMSAKDVVAAVATMGGMLAFLWVLLFAWRPTANQLPQLDAFALIFLGILLGCVAAAGVRAPGQAHRTAIRNARRQLAKTKEGFIDRARSTYPLRGWAMLQTMPLERRTMEQVFLRPRAWLTGAAALIAFSFLFVAYTGQWTGAAEGLLLIVMVGAICGFAALLSMADSAVVPLHPRRNRYLFFAGGAAWVTALMALPFPILLSTSGRGMHLVGLPATAAAIVCSAVTVATPLLVYEGVRERLVQSQRPYESETRYFAMAYGGFAALTIAGLLVLLVL